MPDPAEVADALAAADRSAMQGCGKLATAPEADRRQLLLDWAVRVLEAAGGQEVANSVRRHVEAGPSTGRPAARESDPTHRPAGGLEGARGDAAAGTSYAGPPARRHLLATARELFLAAEQDSVRRLEIAGLRDASGPRSERAAFARTALDDRRDLVLTVLGRLMDPPQPRPADAAT